MDKLFFKKMYINFTIGVLLVAFVLVGTLLTSIIEDFLPYMFAGVLLFFTLKRFVVQIKRKTSKNTSLILTFEFVLDMVAIFLLVYLKSNISLFIGVVIYLRGVAYLLINYISRRKVVLLPYLLNIFFVTLGAFFMFSSVLDDQTLLWIFSIILALFGLAYILYGFLQLRKMPKKAKKTKSSK